MSRVRVCGSYDYVFDSSANDRVGARRRAAMSRAWFKRDEESCSFRFVTTPFAIQQRFNFCVRLAGTAMPAAPDNFSGLYQNRSDHGVGRSFAVSSPGQTQGETHIINMC